MLRHQRRQRFLAGDGGLQERTRRQRDLRGADRNRRRQAHQHQFAMPRQPRQAMFFGETRQFCDHRRRQRSGAAHVDVEPAVGGRDLDIERLADHDQRLGQRPRRIERATEPGIEDRAAIDRNDVVRACRGETDLEHLMRAHPRVQGDAAAADAMGIDQRIHLAGQIGPRQRLHHQIALPGAVALALPMLDRAAAANTKMRAERRDPLRARDLDLPQAPAVGMTTRNRLNFDRLARKRIGHIDGAAAGDRDAVAMMADVIDGEAFNHGARRRKIRGCRRRPRSGTETLLYRCSRARLRTPRYRRRLPDARSRRG